MFFFTKESWDFYLSKSSKYILFCIFWIYIILDIFCKKYPSKDCIFMKIFEEL